MIKKFLLLTIVSLIAIFTLAACGNTATSQTTTVPSAPTNSASTAVGSTTNAATTTTSASTIAVSSTTTTGATTTMTTSPAATTRSNTAMITAATTPTMSGMSGMTPSVTNATTITSTMSAGQDAMTASLQNLSGKDFEIKFMQEMIAHHQGAVEMAQLVPSHTTRPELIKLSEAIISSQKGEIAQMTDWLATWYNTKPLASSMDAPGMMQMMSGMSELQAAKGAAFDKLFMQMMIPHHASAIAMAKLIPGRTQRTQLIDIGQAIISSQSSEIQEMQNWLKVWFNS